MHMSFQVLFSFAVVVLRHLSAYIIWHNPQKKHIYIWLEYTYLHIYTFSHMWHVYAYGMQVLISFAVGGLLGDVFLHMLPHMISRTFASRNHEDEVQLWDMTY